RKISYSTFGILDTDIRGKTKMIQQGNPPFIIIRDGKVVPLACSVRTENRWDDRVFSYSEFECAFGDRIVFFSDGISQAGIGTREHPLGWGDEKICEFLEEIISFQPDISAKDLCNLLLEEAVRKDGGTAGDDITCAVAYYRKPRKLLVLTGPPYDMSTDRDYAMLAERHDGRVAICGGTTSNIVARELGRDLSMDLTDLDPEIPTTSEMPGVSLVTEGCLTLGKAAELLESGMDCGRVNGATRLVDHFLESDIIRFVVGTRINEAHQNPELPVELEIRRNVVKKIARLLEEKYLKETSIEFV
ncbi:MAG TPA: SpoIIE family protein phosphatase, partial [Armatimonadota bacterium]